MSHAPEAPRLAETAKHKRLPEHDLLNSLIGKWMTEGETISNDGSPALKIQASDIYEWVPGQSLSFIRPTGELANSPSAE
jgi:hypothetical protein